jgi:hypothetical protein
VGVSALESDAESNQDVVIDSGQGGNDNDNDNDNDNADNDNDKAEIGSEGEEQMINNLLDAGGAKPKAIEEI